VNAAHVADGQKLAKIDRETEDFHVEKVSQDAGKAIMKARQAKEMTQKVGFRREKGLCVDGGAGVGGEASWGWWNGKEGRRRRFKEQALGAFCDCCSLRPGGSSYPVVFEYLCICGIRNLFTFTASEEDVVDSEY